LSAPGLGRLEEDRGRLVRAVIERVEVEEPKVDVRTFASTGGGAPNPRSPAPAPSRNSAAQVLLPEPPL